MKDVEIKYIFSKNFLDISKIPLEINCNSVEWILLTNLSA